MCSRSLAPPHCIVPSALAGAQGPPRLLLKAGFPHFPCDFPSLSAQEGQVGLLDFSPPSLLPSLCARLSFPPLLWGRKSSRLSFCLPWSLSSVVDPLQDKEPSREIWKSFQRTAAWPGKGAGLPSPAANVKSLGFLPVSWEQRPSLPFLWGGGV